MCAGVGRHTVHHVRKSVTPPCNRLRKRVTGCNVTGGENLFCSRSVQVRALISLRVSAAKRRCGGDVRSGRHNGVRRLEKCVPRAKFFSTRLGSAVLSIWGNSFVETPRCGRDTSLCLAECDAGVSTTRMRRSASGCKRTVPTDQIIKGSRVRDRRR